jgi:hypothetical protein
MHKHDIESFTACALPGRQQLPLLLLLRYVQRINAIFIHRI